MFVIKRTDNDQYFSEWTWMDNPWDAKQYDATDAEGAVAFFNDMGITCVAEEI